MISVCIATYNGEKYLREQLDSIVFQLSKDDEIIVSDDGSTDLTESIILSYEDKRIIYLKNKSRHGFVGNFENALRYAKGDIIILCDQDDIWKSTKIEVVKKTLEYCDLMVHDADLINGEGIRLGRNYYSTIHSKTDFWSNFWKTRFLGCCMAFRSSVLEYCMPFPSNIVAHDYWIGMYALTKFKVEFVPDILISYRRHGANASPSSEKSNTSFFYKLIAKRGYLLWSVTNRYVRAKIVDFIKKRDLGKSG